MESLSNNRCHLSHSELYLSIQNYQFTTIDETVCQYHERTRDKQIDQRLQQSTKEK